MTHQIVDISSYPTLHGEARELLISRGLVAEDRLDDEKLFVDDDIHVIFGLYDHEDGKLVGVCAGGELAPEYLDDEKTFAMDYLAVDAKKEKNGFAGELLAEMKSKARELGCAVLTVYPDKATRQFLLYEGFSEVENSDSLVQRL